MTMVNNASAAATGLSITTPWSGVFARCVWGVVGMLVGVIIAAQLTWPELFWHSWLSYGRLRTAAPMPVIFAFGGSGASRGYFVVFAAHLPGSAVLPTKAAFTFWGWQLVIVAAAISLPLGFTSKGNTPSWVADRHPHHLVWVAYAIVFFGTVGTRKVRHIWANWFFGGLHPDPCCCVVNSAATAGGADEAIRHTPACRTRWVQ